MNRLVQQGGLGVFDELRREMDHFLGRVVAPASNKSSSQPASQSRGVDSTPGS